MVLIYMEYIYFYLEIFYYASKIAVDKFTYKIEFWNLQIQII